MGNFIEEKIDEKYQGEKLEKYIRNRFELSNRFVKKAFSERRVLINGESGRRSNQLKAGDMVRIVLDRDETQDIPGEEMDIKVAYEDSQMMVVDKAPFMVVHPTKSHPKGTLSNGVKYHMESNGENCIVRMANRLDMNTSGLVMVAKNQFAHMKISSAMQKNLIRKEYLAIVQGTLAEKKGTINEPIGRRTLDSIEREVLEDGLPSVTHYEVLEEKGNMSLLKVRLETGRTHQIRVHMKHIGHPIIGDTLYGEEHKKIDRQALHAYKLSIPHPLSGEVVQVQSEMPDDMKELFLSK